MDMRVVFGMDQSSGRNILWSLENRHMVEQGDGFQRITCIDFNGEVDSHAKPRAISVKEQLQHAAKYEAWKEAGYREGIAGDLSKLYGIKKINILYRLSYWKVRQCDVQRQALLINYYVMTTMQLINEGKMECVHYNCINY
jgi:hypothetical protein